MSLYQLLIDDDVEEAEIEQKIGEGWTLEQIAEHHEVCRCIDCGGDQPSHDPYCHYMRETFE